MRSPRLSIVVIAFALISVGILAIIGLPYSPLSPQEPNPYGAASSSVSALTENVDAGSLAVIWYYDEASDTWSFYSFSENLDGFNTLQELQPGEIYYIIANGDITLSVDGNDYQLSDGAKLGHVSAAPIICPSDAFGLTRLAHTVGLACLLCRFQ